jgi:DNA polymerase-3 subunit delta'
VSGAVPEEPDRLEGAPHPRETPALYGQAEAEAGFLAALAGGRPHHAWLITGPRGVGKATLAWRIARHLIAGGAGGSLDMDPADPVFRRVAALGEPRLFLCRRPWDAEKERLKTAVTVDEVRALKAFFHLSAPDGGWRVAIVDAADELTDSAANALLKVLEEPPARAVLLLVCHQPARLLPTIRSRCRELRCRPLGADDLAAALAQAGAAPEPEAAGRLAALADGSAGAALRLAASDGLALYGEILDLLAAAPPLDRRHAVALAESCAGRSRAARYDLALELIRTALARLALGAAGAAAAASPAEGRTMARVAANPEQARLWAETATRLGARMDHARGVHLDPAQVILDTFLQIDAAAARALLLAA